MNETAFNLRVSNKQFVGLEDENGENNLVANLDSPGNKETFEIVRNDDDPNKVRIRAPNGLFLQVYSALFVCLALLIDIILLLDI